MCNEGGVVSPDLGSRWDGALDAQCCCFSSRLTRSNSISASSGVRSSSSTASRPSGSRSSVMVMPSILATSSSSIASSSSLTSNRRRSAANVSFVKSSSLRLGSSVPAFCAISTSSRMSIVLSTRSRSCPSSSSTCGSAACASAWSSTLMPGLLASMPGSMEQTSTGSPSVGRFTTVAKIVTQMISMVSMNSSLRSSGINGEKEMQCTNGQNRQPEDRAGHAVVLTSAAIKLGDFRFRARIVEVYMVLRKIDQTVWSATTFGKIFHHAPPKPRLASIHWIHRWQKGPWMQKPATPERKVRLRSMLRMLRP
mmetsp:Transcript_20084/g.51440  ORF Transcript_20084/g.51440 Transcript_20084/m.51440 type:complete len:310 (+) Transcript_20084:307-1236(+)